MREDVVERIAGALTRVEQQVGRGEVIPVEDPREERQQDAGEPPAASRGARVHRRARAEHAPTRTARLEQQLVAHCCRLLLGGVGPDQRVEGEGEQRKADPRDV
jgi:hypothetical protein